MKIYETALTGVKMNKKNAIAAGVESGSVLFMMRRPDNAYDDKAISVHSGPGEPQIGWIPANTETAQAVKGVIAGLLDAGYDLELHATQVDLENNFIRCEVHIEPNGVVENVDIEPEDLTDCGFDE